MPTLGISRGNGHLLTEDKRRLAVIGSVPVESQPTKPSLDKGEPVLPGYYTMPEKTTEISAIIPAHGEILSLIYQQQQNKHIRALPGPSPNMDEPDMDHLANFTFYIFSVVIAVLLAVGVTWYMSIKHRKQVVSATSAAQTHRSVASVEKDENGRRVYHVGKLQFYPDVILGYGSAGTIVYEGNFDSRRVAVKRLVPELCGLAEKEAQLLRLSDKHSNVIRYFLTEQDSHFCYLALELAAGTLADFVEGNLQHNFSLTTLEIIEQALHGLQHLHGLGIVHRDLKPHNVLISMPHSKDGPPRALISDFGLCKRISHTSSWVAKTSSMGRTIGGTEGWIAPEILRRCFSNEKESDEQLDVVMKPNAPAVTAAVDIFSAGCLIYYALTKGKHPFGEPIKRQVNIQAGKADFFELVKMGMYPAKDLVEWMVTIEPHKRPTVHEVLAHPMFWPAAKQLGFLLDISDRLEKVKPEDRCPALINLERNSSIIVNHDWRKHVGDELQAELRSRRSYRGNSVRDLLRAIRNKKHHYQELSEEMKATLGEIPNGFLSFFTSRFPKLLIHVYRSSSCLGDEPLLSCYYHKTSLKPNPKSAPSDLCHQPDKEQEEEESEEEEKKENKESEKL